MSVSTAFLLLLAILLEIAREVCFKLGADQTTAKQNAGYLHRIFGKPLIWVGFLCWIVEIVAWIHVLSRMELSVAFPIMSLCYVGTIIASKYVLKETITPMKWCGIVAVSIGVAIIGSQGGS